MHNKCNVLESSQNHPPPPWFMEKLSSTKLVPGAKKVGDRCPNGYEETFHLVFKEFFKLINLFIFIFGCIGSLLLHTGFL